ncbi:MAG: type II toxin-antitoxin system RatA family toxin [Alphaproteobacteria bacterium]|nr:type II toxin-antitoxin system RatA family toxin [Alphaproteobacteria bacterium]
MPSLRRECSVDYSPEQLFALAVDVERYPEFLPFCLAARIRERGERQLTVDNVYGNALGKIRFQTRAELQAPHGLIITALDGPFAHFTVSWRFEPLAENGQTRLTFVMDHEFKNRVMKSLSAIMGEKMKNQTFEAFVKRARSLYGTQT